MSEQENEIKDPFPRFDWDFLCRNYPEWGGDGEAITTEDCLYLLREGDELVWNDRSLPLRAKERLETYENEYTQGYRKPAWHIEGPSGGLYVADIWHYWGPEAESGFDVQDDVIVQVHRRQEGSLTDGEAIEELALDFELTTYDGLYHNPEDLIGCDVVHNARRPWVRGWGEVVDVEYGKLIIDPEHPNPRSESEYALEPEEVHVWRDDDE
jgi:hypothetical protein